MANKKRKRLRMQKPSYFDATDDKVLHIQRLPLEKLLKESYWNGFKAGSLPGIFLWGLSLIFAIVTAEKFVDYLGIEGATWKALFIILSSFAILIFIVVGLNVFRKSRKKEFSMDLQIRELFDEENKID